jgi:hypothetical protein
MCTKNEHKIIYTDTSKVVNVVGYIACTIFGTPDSMKEGVVTIAELLSHTSE